MRTRFRLLQLLGLMVFTMVGAAQAVLFDFDHAPAHTPLPLALTVDGVTARFSATGQGFSIQPANTMGFTPAGFSGNCIYPSSVFAADLLIGFSQVLTGLSVLYAPQELACDSSATMRVTAFRGTNSVGTATAMADPPGTWPSATLSITAALGFDNVVVHYDKPPPTGGDWGPIFLADNLMVTLGPPTLRIFRPAPDSLGLAWPASAMSFTLQQNATIASTNWFEVTNAVSVVAGENQVIAALAPGEQFFRLVRP